jgi:hypothetical protein
VVYGIETEITPVCVPTAKEISNDCVQISWLALKAIQMCKDADEVISRLYANIYRLHILGTHKETDVGKQFGPVCG